MAARWSSTTPIGCSACATSNFYAISAASSRSTTEAQDVGRFWRLFTFLPLKETAELEKRSGADINAAKDVLPFEAPRITHGDEAARKAQQTAQARFGGQASTKVRTWWCASRS